jgi:hypothetical protein
MPGVEDDHVVQTLAANEADHALHRRDSATG